MSLHTVNDPQTRFDTVVHATDSHSKVSSHTVVSAHRRSSVVVGAAVSYSTMSPAHTVVVLHFRSLCDEGATVWYSKAVHKVVVRHSQSFVAVASPGGVDVALCTEDSGPESPTVTVSYYEKSTVGDYFTVYDPPYIEKGTTRERILCKLSHPIPNS